MYQALDPQLRVLVGKDEKVLWYGKPDKKCFILEGIFNPMLPIAFIWGLIDFAFIGGMLFATKSKGAAGGPPLLFLIGFFALHLMPVWLYLLGALTTFTRYRNTSYIITDQAVYISGGFISRSFTRKPFAELAPVNLHIGIIDKFIGVGDVVFEPTNVYAYAGNNRFHTQEKFTICDIREYEKVYQLVRDLQRDVYSDVQYPNAYRPTYNPGYKTKYTKAEEAADFQEDFYNKMDK